MKSMTDKPWYRLKDQDLLEKKISDLDLKISTSGLGPLIQKLYEELRSKGLFFNPPCFVADEWFCPVNVPAIGIPFFLTHSRLRQLELKMMLEVEGATKSSFMKLIRHEAGHAYTYAFGLNKKWKYRQLFGPSSQEYKDTYAPKPYSKSFVLHLDQWYAQSHPDEDFAETFAVWLTPGLNWKKKYRGWNAIKKLEWVDTIMQSIAGKKPSFTPTINPKEFDGLSLKLKTFYNRKRKTYADSYPDFYDNDLKTLFTDSAELASSLKAKAYLKNSRPYILKSVARWTKERKYTIDQLLKDLIERCDELNLYVRKDDVTLGFEVSAYITSLINNYLFTGKFKY